MGGGSREVVKAEREKGKKTREEVETPTKKGI